MIAEVVSNGVLSLPSTAATVGVSLRVFFLGVFGVGVMSSETRNWETGWLTL
jgi:hypothetical protein